ncbi:MAG: hypothetical protein OEV73_05045 [Desulfobulbaceae bacterium]|nr:hypothetical protein [Desulfobulbaceae bacterium]
MHTKTITLVVVVLLALLAAACTNEPETPPSASPTDSPVAASPSLADDESQTVPPTNNTAHDNTPAPCTAILNTHCVVCHHATRICQKLGKKNRKGWERTISNMISHGAQLTPAEKKTLIDCLDRQTPEVQEYCR